MINNTELLKDLQQQLDSKNISDAQRVLLSMRFKQMLVDTLKVGDLVQGIIKDVGENNFVLEIRPNVQIPVMLSGANDINQLKSFVVKEKEEGKLYLSSLEKEPQKYPITDKVINELKLPNNKMMQSIINDFIDKQLPLDKNMLTEVYYNEKTYSLPAKVLINLISQQQPLNAQNMNALQTIRENGFQSISNTIKGMLNELNVHKDLTQVFQTVVKNFSPSTMKEALVEFIQKNEIQYKEMGKDKELYPLKEMVKEMEQLTKQSSDSKVEEFTENTFRQVLGKIPEILKEDKGLFKMIINHLYDKTVALELKELKQDTELLSKIFESNYATKEVVEELQKMNISPEGKEHLAALKENINLISNINSQGHYFVFPFMHDNKRLEGELYFFKPEKFSKGRKQDDKNIYIVLALDFPSIDHIEVHINKQDKDIYLTFNVLEESIKRHMSQYVDRIEGEMTALGYKIKSLTWGYLKEQDSSVLPPMQSSYQTLNHLDLKA